MKKQEVFCSVDYISSISRCLGCDHIREHRRDAEKDIPLYSDDVPSADFIISTEWWKGHCFGWNIQFEWRYGIAIKQGLFLGVDNCFYYEEWYSYNDAYYYDTSTQTTEDDLFA